MRTETHWRGACFDLKLESQFRGVGAQMNAPRFVGRCFDQIVIGDEVALFIVYQQLHHLARVP